MRVKLKPQKKPVFALPSKATLIDSKAYRAFWASMHTQTYLQMQAGNLFPRAQAVELVGKFLGGFGQFCDALPDMIADKFNDESLIQPTLDIVDAFRREVAEHVVDALERASREYGYGVDLVFVDADTGDFVDPIPGGAKTMDMHVSSPVIVPGDVPKFQRLIESRVFGNPFAAAKQAAQDVLLPPDRSTVIESARDLVRVSIPGGFVGSYDPSLTPYMHEPMRALTDRAVHCVAFAGPSQASKTLSLVDAYVLHSIVRDPADITVVHPAEGVANDYAAVRLARLIEGCDEAARRQIDSSTKRRKFTGNNVVQVTHPSINTLSGKSIPRMVLTDFDRMPLDIGGEGSPFDMADGRTKVFKTRGKIVVESSPGFEIDPQYRPPELENGAEVFEAPTTPGILGIYNSGSRGRWYTQCKHCREPFRFENANLMFDKLIDDPEEMAERAMLVCTQCGGLHSHSDKNDLNALGFWVHERESNTKSFWLQGVAARWSTWAQLVAKRVIAQRHADQTNDYSRLKTTINIDWGEPYQRKTDENALEIAADFKSTAQPTGLVQRQMPDTAGLVLFSIDVQNRRFVVQAHAWGMGGESWIIDRFNIAKSTRIAPDGSSYGISPMTHPEDWQLLTPLFDREFKRSDGKVFKPYAIICDMQGGSVTTRNAYAYWRAQRKEGRENFFLCQGWAPAARSQKQHPRYRMSVADGQANAKGRMIGGVPFILINTLRIKDEIFAHIARTEPGPNKIHLPEWIGDWFFNELAAEERTARGYVKRSSRSNNEAGDLCVYQRALWGVLGGEDGKLDHLLPVPAWADAIEIAQALPADGSADMAALARRLNG